MENFREMLEKTQYLMNIKSMSPLPKVLDYSEHCLFLIYISSGRIFRILKNGNFLIFFLTAAFDIFTHQTRTEELSGSVTNANEKKTARVLCAIELNTGNFGTQKELESDSFNKTRYRVFRKNCVFLTIH